jgi:hypothetical protein
MHPVGHFVAPPAITSSVPSSKVFTGNVRWTVRGMRCAERSHAQNRMVVRASQRRETMNLKKLTAYGLLVVGLLAGIGLSASAHDTDDPPSSEQVEFAQKTSDLLLATLFAALTQEFDETTPANVEEGKHSISLVFNDRNRDIRLVGTFGPLQANNRPRDTFERTAHTLALTGQQYTNVEQVDHQWYYRRSIPLSNFRVECSYCHSNFPTGPTQDWVGALMLRVPIE